MISDGVASSSAGRASCTVRAYPVTQPVVPTHPSGFVGGMKCTRSRSSDRDAMRSRNVRPGVGNRSRERGLRFSFALRGSDFRSHGARRRRADIFFFDAPLLPMPRNPPGGSLMARLYRGTDGAGDGTWGVRAGSLIYQLSFLSNNERAIRYHPRRPGSTSDKTL